ncbi:tRNA 4-thiouridine(8) synthase ThiI [bacterium]|nr:tRNA 4-thiouridine(8) synthase ThiI [bacterium]
MQYDALLIRYDEIAIKGRNRGWFESLLVNNIRKALDSKATVRTYRGRIVIEIGEKSNFEEVKKQVSFIPGIAGFSPVIRLPLDASMETIESTALLLADRALELGLTVFRVSCTRPNKQYPVKSPDVQKNIAAHVLRNRDKMFTVSMKQFQWNLEIEIANKDIFLFMERVKGIGGLPVGSAGEVLTLLSGGLDSPVASFLTMRRGAVVHYISFYSPPFTGEESMQKLEDLALHLKKFQGRSTRLHILPFMDIQLLIKERCFENYRTVLFRRLMFRLAERIADKYGYKALVTGESLSQVASQTIENITCINDAVDHLPVIRPLITNEKNETIVIARNIETYEISIRPAVDSCTAFMPKNPVIRGTSAKAAQEEAKLHPLLEELMTKSIENEKVINI